MAMEIITQREFDFALRRIELEMLLKTFSQLEQLKRDINDLQR